MRANKINGDITLFILLIPENVELFNVLINRKHYCKTIDSKTNWEYQEGSFPFPVSSFQFLKIADSWQFADTVNN